MSQSVNSKKYSHLRPMIKEALEKAASFCAYQERCQQEVRKRLIENKFDEEDIDEVMIILIQEGFIDEVRFAKAFCGGKFRVNKWGKRKITQHLKHKKISDYCIRKGLEEINQGDYLTVMEKLIEKKSALVKDKNQYVRKHKIVNFMVGKGYEHELILSYL